MKQTDQNLADLCHSLAMLLGSGISPADGCFLLARETGSSLLTRLGEKLDGGLTLSEAMAETGGFEDGFRALVAAGEETGRLEETLRTLGDHYAYRAALARQLRQTLAWPGLILLLTLGVLGALLVKVLPVFQEVYASLGSGLSGTGARLLILGQKIQEALPVLLALAVLICAGCLVVCCHERLRGGCLTLCRRHLGDRGVFRKFNNARFVQGLSLGLASGMELSRAAELAGSLLTCVPGAARRCDRLMEQLHAGMDFPRALEENGLLTPSQGRLLAVGIRSGSGEAVMAQLARDMTREAGESVELLLSRVEPAMVLAASAAVGGILLSVMLPLTQILTGIG